MGGKVETITIQNDRGDDVEYARVVTRLKQIHEDRLKVSITTEWELTNTGHVVIGATVETVEGKYTGHSMAKLLGPKQFETAETIAVGRALAFAGYLASGEIACAEEMEMPEVAEKPSVPFE